MRQEVLYAEAAAAIITGLEHDICNVIVGKHILIRRILTALFAAILSPVFKVLARSDCVHLLLEFVPAVAQPPTTTTLPPGATWPYLCSDPLIGMRPCESRATSSADVKLRYLRWAFRFSSSSAALSRRFGCLER